MAGARIANLIARVLMNSMMPTAERKALDGLWRQVNNLRYQWDSGVGGTIAKLEKSVANEG